MSLVIISVQIVLPLALILWLAFWPATSRAGLILQIAGTGAFLLALSRVSHWAVPVWWLPWLYGVLWLVALLWVASGWVRVTRPAFPAGLRGWATAALSLFLLAAGGWYGVQALAARTSEAVVVVDIANPFGPGHYMVGHGGFSPVVNGHMRTLDTTVARYRPWRGQSYAVDFVGLDAKGLRGRGWQPADPAAYAIFGAPLHAPCDGVVVAAEGEMPDFRVPEQDSVNRLGNHVIIRCDGFEVVLAHMQQHSLRVEAGTGVTTGDPLGRVGNSGASTEPHLHIHAQRPPVEGSPPISGEPLGIRIEGRALVRNDRLTGRWGNDGR